MSFLDEVKRKKEQGQRGKVAEAEVRKVLVRLGERDDFDWERIYDARSAQQPGKFPPRPGDFAFYTPRVHGLIEVKEVKHDYRLPIKNFGDRQVGLMRKRELAGGEILIVVFHSTTGRWRFLTLANVRAIMTSGDASLDLSAKQDYKNAAEALKTASSELYDRICWA